MRARTTGLPGGRSALEQDGDNQRSRTRKESPVAVRSPNGLASGAAGRAVRTHLRRNRRQQRHRARSSPRPRRTRRPRRAGGARHGQGRDGRVAPRGARLNERRRAGPVRPRPGRGLRQGAARPPQQRRRPDLQCRRHGRAVAAHPAGLRAADGHQPSGSRSAGRGVVAAASRERLARRRGVEHRGARGAAFAGDDPGAAAQPGAVPRPAGLPEHQAGQPPVRAGATPPLRQGRFAGQRRRRAPGRQFDQPVRPPTRAGRTWLAGPCQQGCHRGAAPVGRRRCAVHPPGARSRHAERRLCRPRQFGQLRGRPELLDVYPSARDPATAARLWELTEQALGGPCRSDRGRHRADRPGHAGQSRSAR